MPRLHIVALIVALHVSSLFALNSAHAQNLPGVSLNDVGIPANVKTLFQLAEQVYPELFTGRSGWRSHGGYTYQYYAAGNVYAGVMDGNVFLLGGPFGSTIVQKGDITNAISALQRNLGNTGGVQPGAQNRDTDFSGFTAFPTLASVMATFKELGLEYVASTGSISVRSVVKIRLIETVSMNGQTVDHLTYVMSGTAAPNPLQYDIWLDRQNRFHKITFNGSEYPANLVQTMGENLFGTFVVALAVNPQQLQAVLNDEVRNPALSTRVQSHMVGKVPAKVLTVRISTTPSYFIEYDIADLGDFSVSIRTEGSLPGSKTLLTITDMELR